MSDDKIAVELKKREAVGKGLNRLRQNGEIPAVIHDHGKPSLSVTGDFLELSKVYAQAGKRHPVYLNLDGKQRLAIIKDADFEPIRRTLRHVVFQSIKQDEKVTADIPVVLTGEEIPAEKAGHIVLPQLDAIQIEALPKDLPDKFELDATGLAEVGDRLTVADLTVPPGVTVLTEPEHSIAVVEMPKDQIAEANAAAEALAEETEEPKTTEESAEAEPDNAAAQTEQKE